MIDRRLAGMAVAVMAAMLAGCASKKPATALTAFAPAPAYAPTLLPPGGASANLTIPQRRADGSYPTPNEGLSADAAVWHLRVAMNVAALGCRGASEHLLVSSYNQWIRSRKTTLAAAERRLIGEFHGSDADRAAYDGAMTKLYNYFAQPPAQAGFCNAAARVASEIALVQPDAIADYAARAVPLLDAPFTDFYRAYDSWREARANPQFASYARTGASIGVAATTPTGKPPRIAINPSVFKTP